MKLLHFGGLLHILRAGNAKYGFGRLTDLARIEAMAAAKHVRPVVLAIEEYERLVALDAAAAKKPKQDTGETP